MYHCRPEARAQGYKDTGAHWSRLSQSYKDTGAHWRRETWAHGHRDTFETGRMDTGRRDLPEFHLGPILGPDLHLFLISGLSTWNGN